MFSSSSLSYPSSSRQQPSMKRKEHPYDYHPYQSQHQRHPEIHCQNYPLRHPLEPLQELAHQHHSHKSLSVSLPSLPVLPYTQSRSSNHLAHLPIRQRLHSNASISSSASWNSCPQLISTSSSYASSVASSATPSASNSPQLHHRDDNLLHQHHSQHPYRLQQHKRIKGDRQECPQEVKEETESFRHKHAQEHRPPLPQSHSSHKNASQLPMSRQSSTFLPQVPRPKPLMTRGPPSRPRAMRHHTRSGPSTPSTLSDLVYAIELDATLTRDASALIRVKVSPAHDKSLHPVQQQKQKQEIWPKLECEQAKENALSNKTARDLHARWIQNHMERAKQFCSSSSSLLLSRPQHSQRLMRSYA